MPTNDSTTGGYIVPDVALQNLYDNALEDLFQPAIVGVTGLPATLVRPRVQPEPPDWPDFATDWVAFSVSVQTQDAFTYQVHDPNAVTTPTGPGADRTERDEWLDVACVFYGPNSSNYMARWRDGMMIEQNRRVLGQSGIKLVAMQSPVYLPVLLKLRNVKSVNLKATFARRVESLYPIRTVASATGTVDIDGVTFNLSVNP